MMHIKEDKYNERLVTSKAGASPYIQVMLAVFVMIIGAAMVVFVNLFQDVSFALLGILLFGFGIFWIVKALKQRNTEYEFIITDGDIEVAKIINKANRKQIMFLPETEITIMDNADSDYVKNQMEVNSKLKIKEYCGIEPENRIAFFAKHNSEDMLVIMDLDEASINHMKTVLRSRSRI